jgi:hypothetical protein
VAAIHGAKVRTGFAEKLIAVDEPHLFVSGFNGVVIGAFDRIPPGIRHQRTAGKDDDGQFRLGFADDLEKLMDPSLYIGRAPQQVEAYLAGTVRPLLEERRNEIGKPVDILV